MNVMAFIRSVNTRRVLRWATDSNDPSGVTEDTEIAALAESDVFTSEDADRGTHSIVLDIDRPAALLQSTNGNWHLVIPARLDWTDYARLLDLLAELGIVEAGYVASSKRRGFSAVRLPWIEKPGAMFRTGEQS